MFKINNYLSFWYYHRACEEKCNKCAKKNEQNLLRYRVFLGFKKPLIQIKTNYFLVCSSCGALKILDGEGKIAPYINRIKDQKAKKYMTIDDQNSIELLVKEHLNI